MRVQRTLAMVSVAVTTGYNVNKQEMQPEECTAQPGGIPPATIQQLGIQFSVLTKVVQWNPFITDTFGDQHFVRYSEVSPTQGLPVYFR